MQLGRTLFLVILAGLGTACAARPAPTPTREPAAAPPVGYASVTAAEVTEPTKEAPVVGKSQWSAPERERETLDEPKAAPRRHAPRTTGGFSGYK